MNVLEVEGLRKNYGRVVALDGVDLALEEGYVMGLVGPNGAGKTTLAGAVLGLVAQDSGGVRIAGLDLESRPCAAKEKLGFVLDECRLVASLTIGETETILRSAYPRWDRRAFARLLDRFKLSPKAKVKTLSKGMKTRASVAMALSHRAELVVMDEPTSGLDPIVRRDLLDAVGEYMEAEGRGVVFSTHVTSDLDRIADYVALMEGGKVRYRLSRTDIETSWALCKGGPDLDLSGADGLLMGVRRGPYGFTAVTGRKTDAAARFGPALVLERPGIEDLVVHLLDGGSR